MSNVDMRHTALVTPLVELKGSRHMVATRRDCSEYTHGTNSLLHYVEALMQWLGNWQQEFGHMCVALVFNVVVDQCWLRLKKLSSQMWENTYHWQRTNQSCDSTVHLPHLGLGKTKGNSRYHILLWTPILNHVEVPRGCFLGAYMCASAWFSLPTCLHSRCDKIPAPPPCLPLIVWQGVRMHARQL